MRREQSVAMRREKYKKIDFLGFDLFCCKEIREQLEHSRSGEKHETSVECFSLHFFRVLVASCVLYKRTEHSPGFVYLLSSSANEGSKWLSGTRLLKL